MKKYFYLVLSVIFIILLAIVFNIDVTTKQCINYQCYSIRLPLYLKTLDFFDRYYNYKRLVKKITEGARTDEERVMKIFEWTYRNIKRVPVGMPVVDDHIWYTIVRGYGARDQYSDIFSTLCNQTGIKSFFSDVSGGDSKGVIPLSFVRIKGSWAVFDPYNGIYFKTSKDTFAEIEVIRSKNYELVALDAQPRTDTDYLVYLRNLPMVDNLGLSRANTQSPFNRLFLEVKRHMRFNRD